MTTSLLQGRRFYCREWAFSKVSHCLENRATAKTCGALIMAGPGCGKSALCAEMVWPTDGYGRQASLSRRLLAHYFCQAHDIETLSISNFIHCLVEQISRSGLISGYDLSDPAIQAALHPAACENDPDEAFRIGILEPLQRINPPSQTVFILVDSIDESYVPPPPAVAPAAPTSSRSIAALLSAHHAAFPAWLLLVCSARKQSRAVTRLFTGFRKISLDDLRKSHVVRDVQQYILCRLDQEEELRQHLSRETAEMLNQLHIKSNGCFLYLEKVLDGVADNFIFLREIRDIPGTLNGLYLWLCQRLFARRQFDKIRPLLDVILAARRPLTEMELYSCAYTRNTALTFPEFRTRLDMLGKVLIEGKDATKILFHHSFAEWLLDVKHCTQKYLCCAGSGHSMLALSFTMHAASLSPVEVQDFALHLVKSQPGSSDHGGSAGAAATPGALAGHLAPLWLLASGADVENSLAPGLPKDQAVLKLLLECGARPPLVQDAHSDRLMTSSISHEPPDGDAAIQAILSAAPAAVDALDTNGRSALHTAAHEGNLPALTALINKGASVDLCDSAGQTALNLAARHGHAHIAAALLGTGADVDHTDADGWTALRSAAWGGHTEVVRVLLTGGAAVDHADGDARTALRAAAWGGHEDIVTTLLEHGAEVNRIDNEGRTALIAAAYMGHTEIVEHLIESGADVDHEDIDGRTALSVAALCIPASHAAVVSCLLERGAAVDHRDKDGMTPLLVAAYEGHTDVCELLLEADADVDHADNTGRSPLQAAASMGHAAVVSLLLFWGCAVDMMDADGRTVLCVAAQQGSADVVRQLLDRGLDEGHRDNAGWTPAHMAAFEGHTEVVSALLDAGARVASDVDNDGRVAMLLAAQEGHAGAVRVLLGAGTSVEARGHDGRTALRVAALEGHTEVVLLLLEAGADLDYRDADGRTTLYVLALENMLPMAQVLLDNGADRESADLEGRTPLHVAAWQGHGDMAAALLRAGAKVNATDNDARTPLQSAAWQGRAALVRLLLGAGAAVDHTCNQGATALCIAAQEGHDDTVRALLECRADPNHADQFGRTAARVAHKGGHQNVVRILEEFGATTTAAPALNGGGGGGGRRAAGDGAGASGGGSGGAITTTSISAGGKPAGGAGGRPQRGPSQLLQQATAIANGQLHLLSDPAALAAAALSPGNGHHDETDAPGNRRYDDVPAAAGRGNAAELHHYDNIPAAYNSYRSSGGQSGGGHSTAESGGSKSSTGHSQTDLSFTQQLQQASSRASGSRPLSRIHLSPVSEPRPRGSQPHVVPSPSRGAPASPRGGDLTTAQQPTPTTGVRIITNPAADDAGSAIWQPRGVSTAMPSMGSAGVTMGSAALSLKSPADRRKQAAAAGRNGIQTNPNYAKSVSMNGYFNQLANLPDADDDDDADVDDADDNNLYDLPPGAADPPRPRAPARPNGLPLKKETPL